MRQCAAPYITAFRSSRPCPTSKPDRQKRVVMRNLPDFSILWSENQPQKLRLSNIVSGSGFPWQARTPRRILSATCWPGCSALYGRSLRRGRPGARVAGPQGHSQHFLGYTIEHKNLPEKRTKLEFFVGLPDPGSVKTGRTALAESSRFGVYARCVTRQKEEVSKEH
jgi:hypothetical protein